MNATPASDAYFAPMRAGAHSYTITAEMTEAKRAEDAAAMADVPAPKLAPATMAVKHDAEMGCETITVSAAWLPQEGLDRLDVGGWSVGRDTPAHRRLAARLMAAIDAGVVVEPGEPYVDIDGNRGWHATRHILGRTMNADLRRLGY